jgi:hypothetical protein
LGKPRDRIYLEGLADEALEGPAFAVVRETKSAPRNDIQPSKRLRRERKLVEGIEARRLVVRKIKPVEFRPYTESPPVLADTCLSVVVDG